MITKNIDLDIIDDEGQESAVEVIMGNVERAVLVGTISITSKDQIEKLVLKIERFMQDLSDDNTETSKFTLKRINESLKVILPILKSDDINQMSLEVIDNYLTNLEKISKIAISKKSIKEVESLFTGLSLDELKRNLENTKVSIWTYANALNGMIESTSNKVTLINYGNASDILRMVTSVKKPNKLIDLYIKNDKKDDLTWDVDLKISNKDDSKSIYSLWLLLEAFKSIDGLEFEIEELSKGSIFAKIKVWFKSEEAKKEAEDLLESTKKFAKGKLENEYYENEKNKSEAEKVQIEKEKLQNEVDLANSDEEKKRRSLELEALEIENENKKLQNERLKVQVFLEKRQALAELLSDGIINNQEYELMINQVLQIHKKDDDSIEIGLLKEKE
ncbi:hypothetical protein [Winogradskyella bathintestinalis]|uniref:Uncharacterized protein n=1 Tax=Winogradskyella bathintestinalis TaxID=3035208 RepID=A0ABT7ZZ70_9FLAO|nr:hypothetical protein [Winogradskyella bathintestinalis]MDN3494282.1 hypothetical protein [Winogradskyella bathintestinalis]